MAWGRAEHPPPAPTAAGPGRPDTEGPWPDNCSFPPHSRQIRPGLPGGRGGEGWGSGWYSLSGRPAARSCVPSPVQVAAAPPTPPGGEAGAWGHGSWACRESRAGEEGQGPLRSPSHGILGRGLKARRATKWQDANPETPETRQFLNSRVRSLPRPVGGKEGSWSQTHQACLSGGTHLLCGSHSGQWLLSGPREAKCPLSVGSACPGVSGKGAAGPTVSCPPLGCPSRSIQQGATVNDSLGLRQA